MPEGTLRRGGPARGPPKHQNSFAFKHNKNSKKTRMIKKISHQGLCKRCFDIIEWRKKYRKYKPLTAPGICNSCKQRTVKRAYHTLCDSCAGGRGICAKCAETLPDEVGAEPSGMDVDEAAAEAGTKAASALKPALKASTKESVKQKVEDAGDEEGGNKDEDLSMEEEDSQEDEEDAVEEDEEEEDEEDEDEE